MSTGFYGVVGSMEFFFHHSQAPNTMEIYLDSNATTPVLPEARAAALAAMEQDFGNPSSTHSTGLRARALVDAARAKARTVLGVASGHMLFMSGATEAIQTAVLSALVAVRERKVEGGLLLYGATEHKAVPTALKHWNAVLGLNLDVLAIPVDRNGLHDLDWLRAHAPRAALVCTMAANNETGVISDLDGIEAILQSSAALWLVDSVQALGKLDLRLGQRRIDYASFSGHKLYAPKGIGLLYVREGAPLTPLMVGGGQEEAARAGTENMAGIAALGAVLGLLQEGTGFQSHATLEQFRAQLGAVLQQAFPGLVFNARPELSLPTTLNFSVPGVSSAVLMNLLDAAGVRVSSGSACSATHAQPSYVLEAMGLPAWQTASAIRLSFGPADSVAFIDEACKRIRACGEAWQTSGLAAGSQNPAAEPVSARFATSLANHLQRLGLAADRAVATPCGELSAAELRAMLASQPATCLVDVREAYEQSLGGPTDLCQRDHYQAVPLSGLVEQLTAWQAKPEQSVVFICRSGGRSAQAAHALRQLGHQRCWSLAGGLALWS